MARITSTNYAGSPTTTFAWATSGTDFFSRTQDLYYLAQALENHDHASGKGLAIQRVANGIITGAMIAAGTIDVSKLAPDTLTAVAIALDAIGALELADNAVDTNAIQNLAVTGAKIADATITSSKLAAGAVTLAAVIAALGYTPFSNAGGNVTGNTIFTDDGEGVVFSSGSKIRDSVGFPGLLFTADQGSWFLYNEGQTTEIMRAREADAAPLFKGNTIWHAGNDGAGSGLDAGSVIAKIPTATPAAGAIPVADGSGKLDSWITASSPGAYVPSGLIGAFATNAAIAAGWSRFNSLDGRMPVGAGTTFSVTYAENTSYGSAWSHSGHAISGSISINPASGGSVDYDEDEAGNGHNVITGHVHGLSGGYGVTGDSWVIPSHAVVWAQKS